MNSLAKKYIILAIALASFLAAIYRDFSRRNEYPSDLRNRIIGARQVKENISPYFYKWKQTDTSAWFDPFVWDTFKVNKVTATPFYHHLISPISNYNFKSISYFWQAFGLIQLLLIAFFCIKLWPKNYDWILLIMALFMHTEAYKMNFITGQYYLHIPTLLVGTYYFLQQKNKYSFLIAALLSVILVLFRPIAVLCLLPLIANFVLYKRYVIASMCMAIAYIVFIFSHKFELQMWKDYTTAVTEHSLIHSAGAATKIANLHTTSLDSFEGFKVSDMNTIDERIVKFSSLEINSAQHIENTVLKKTVPIGIKYGFIIVLSFAVLFFAFRYKLNLYSGILLGFMLYLLLEYIFPVSGFQYYLVQLLFPLLLFSVRTTLFALFSALAALLLVQSFRFIPMQLSLIELMIIFTIPIVVYKEYKSTSQPNAQ